MYDINSKERKKKAMKYTKDLVVDIHDVDFNGVCRLSSLMKYIQSAAEAQLCENGMSYDNLRAMNRAFVLTRITMQVKSAVRANQRLRATTYPCESRGFSFLRCYSLERDGESVAKAASVWALIDTEAKSLVRVNNFELGLETYAPNDVSFNRFTMPKGMEKVGIYPVNYDDTDQNMHMNNTRYPDVYSNFLDLFGKRISLITINYSNEAKAGEVLTVYHGVANGGLHYLRTVKEDGSINSEAEIVLEEIQL